jgi:hypothetical protein
MKTDRQLVEDLLPTAILMRAVEAIGKLTPSPAASTIHARLSGSYQEKLRGADPSRLQAINRRVDRAVKEAAAPFAATQATVFVVTMFRLVRLVTTDNSAAGALTAALDAMDKLVADWDPDGTAAVVAENLFRNFQRNGLFAPR